ncbi:hypothetical protein GH714_036427 [Hevea brasiliensis]|uniref:Uncharacterized protein n=1 Tax=Hevea brasiliensis TaxID=3981 RepID=A0A6A6L483_HEVBR|nr:hypothetical protein GH714_036427 [Hevea brasiliensis]
MSTPSSLSPSSSGCLEPNRPQQLPYHRSHLPLRCRIHHCREHRLLSCLLVQFLSLLQLDRSCTQASSADRQDPRFSLSFPSLARVLCRVNKNSLRVGMLASGVGSVVGCVFLMLALINVVQFKLGTLACGSGHSLAAVVPLVIFVPIALVIYSFCFVMLLVILGIAGFNRVDGDGECGKSTTPDEKLSSWHLVHQQHRMKMLQFLPSAVLSLYIALKEQHQSWCSVILASMNALESASL